MFKEKKTEKESLQIDLEPLEMSELYFMQPVEIQVDPSPGEGGDGAPKIHEGILLVKKEASCSDK